jgi:hypothetical protein
VRTEQRLQVVRVDGAKADAAAVGEAEVDVLEALVHPPEPPAVHRVRARPVRLDVTHALGRHEPADRAAVREEQVEREGDADDGARLAGLAAGGCDHVAVHERAVRHHQRRHVLHLGEAVGEPADGRGALDQPRAVVRLEVRVLAVRAAADARNDAGQLAVRRIEHHVLREHGARRARARRRLYRCAAHGEVESGCTRFQN